MALIWAQASDVATMSLSCLRRSGLGTPPVLDYVTEFDSDATDCRTRAPDHARRSRDTCDSCLNDSHGEPAGPSGARLLPIFIRVVREEAVAFVSHSCELVTDEIDELFSLV